MNRGLTPNLYTKEIRANCVLLCPAESNRAAEQTEQQSTSRDLLSALGSGGSAAQSSPSQRVARVPAILGSSQYASLD